MNVHKVSRMIGKLELSIETGKLATQADGAAYIRYGDTHVLVTACGAKEASVNAHFFPLTCDHRENFYAAGKIPGGFFKREGRPSEREVLSSRMIDRPIRPLFPEGYRNETQIIANVLSADTVNDPSPLSIVGASTALYLSVLPFTQPIAAVRVALIDGTYVVNPTYAELEESSLNLIVAGTADGVTMVEAGANEISEEVMIEAISVGHDSVKQIVEMEQELYEKIRPEKFEFQLPTMDPDVVSKVEELIREELEDALNTQKYDKLTSYAKVDNAKAKAVESFGEADEETLKGAKRAFSELKEKIFRDQILHKDTRPDRRAHDEIRPIWIEGSVLPRTHGSAIFTRGETQALVTVTLGTSDDAQRMDKLEGESFKRFLMHYNFPPFSVGEVRRLMGTSRREVGHGNLAERAILPMVPKEEDFPYTIRIVSDILESNGSSSMATVCGASLALMEAGVPMKRPVAGVAMGLVSEEGKYAVLSDIAGAEDHYGDMDFKVAGTVDGITAIQLDIKIKHITMEMVRAALEQARETRLELLEEMGAAIAAPRDEVSRFAPKMQVIKIPVDKIGLVIGPSGKMIRSITEETGATIDIEEDGSVFVGAINADAADAAIGRIRDLTREIKVGEIFTGKVVKILNFGAFVSLTPGKDGMVHISELAEHRVETVEDVVDIGDEITVVVREIDSMGRINLSRRALLDGGEDGGESDGELAASRPHGGGRSSDRRDRDGNGRPSGPGRGQRGGRPGDRRGGDRRGGDRRGGDRRRGGPGDQGPRDRD